MAVATPALLRLSIGVLRLSPSHVPLNKPPPILMLAEARVTPDAGLSAFWYSQFNAETMSLVNASTHGADPPQLVVSLNRVNTCTATILAFLATPLAGSPVDWLVLLP